MFQATALRALSEKEVQQPDEEEPIMDESTSIDTSSWPPWPTTDEEKEPSELSLQDTNRDTWIGRPVVITKGRGRGSLARVLNTSSGWIQIRQAPEDGSDPMSSEDTVELSKRACDLNVLKGTENYTRGSPVDSQIGAGANRFGKIIS